MKTSAELRTVFLEYFGGYGHEIVPSSSLIPANDPTLLFTNAGMVQFKEVFLGRDERAYVRAASSQRCVRAGGKHNDLKNVGYTARHHTFFEMLGNFSFGDYFKREAIQYAWEFLTEVLRIPVERLWATVYEQDDEAADVWLKEIKIEPARFARIGAKDNFWSMGDTGPCGPCTEIFYDHGPGVPGGPPDSPDADGDRYVEIWNLVFMQYDRDAQGELAPLPKPSVDTGMGLERLAAVIQGKHSNYEIDLFQNLITAVADVTTCKDLGDTSLKVIADHIRSCGFLLVDGVLPSNEGRGYVLRRILRRAIRHGHKLGMREPFFYKLVAPLCTEMGDAYPELINSQTYVEKVLRQEELSFAETLDQGMILLEQAMAKLTGTEIPGKIIFKLYDTHGFPVDLTGDIARERGLTLDIAGFEHEMEAQRERGRTTHRFGIPKAELSLNSYEPSVFTGYDHLSDQGEITQLFVDGNAVDSLAEGEQGRVILDHTPFYAESGGQVGDQGDLISSTGKFHVEDTQKQGDQVVTHFGRVTEGSLNVGDTVKANVNQRARRDTAYNHSATHLLHAALRKVLGDHVTQKGSLVDAERLRFDLSHFEPVSPEQLTSIEYMVNEQIRANHEVQTQVMELDEAMASGAVALFGEKYADQVRVLSMSDFSVELCGGTHVKRTGDIGVMKIMSETGVAAGVRRIEAITGEAAFNWMKKSEALINQIATLVKGDLDDVQDKVRQLVEHNRHLEKDLERLTHKLASSQGMDLAAQAIDIAGTKVLAVRLDNADPKTLRNTLDQLKSKLKTAVVVLATVKGEKVNVVVGVTEDRTDQINAGELVNVVAEQVGGHGGGRPDMAQAGGKDPSRLDSALTSVPNWIRQRLGD